jgi:hypothetical protein
MFPLLALANPATAAQAATGASHQLTVTPPPPGRPGQAAIAVVRLSASAGFKINDEYPTRLVVEAPGGVAPRKLTLGRAQAQRPDESQLVFRPRHQVQRRGRYRITALLRASVCDRRRCVMISERLRWTIVAEAPVSGSRR